MICTGNQCRTPMAEGLLRTRLAAAGIAARVSSAGLMPGGMPATSTAVDVLAQRGIDISAHESRQLDVEQIAQADLVLGMTRAHAREVVVLVRDAFPRTFTVKEIVHRSGLVGPRTPGQPLDEWLAKVGAFRKLDDLMGSDAGDDIADPVGQPRKVYEATAAELDDWLGKLVGVVWPESESPC